MQMVDSWLIFVRPPNWSLVDGTLSLVRQCSYHCVYRSEHPAALPMPPPKSRPCFEVQKDAAIWVKEYADNLRLLMRRFDAALAA